MGLSNYITYFDKQKNGIRYGSDLAIYTERLIDGRLVCAAYQDNGIPIHEYSEFTDTPAFDLIIDGESLNFGWLMKGFETQKKKDGNTYGTLILKHTYKPVVLEITTCCCGYGFFKRSIKIINTSKDAFLCLTSVTPLSGKLWNIVDNLAENLRDNTVIPYSIGHFKDFWWSNEGNFDWQDVPLNTGIFFSSTSGQSGHSSPFFILRNNIYGGWFICHLGWSSNWKTSVFADYNNDRHVHETKVSLNFDIMPISSSPARVIAPGETIMTPEVHFGINHENFDTAIQNLHSHLRKSVLKSVGNGLQPVIYNHSGYMQPSDRQRDISEEGLMAEIDIAAEIGAELFTIDAGWYCDIGTLWTYNTGDWHTGNCLPNDLFPVFEYIRKKGLKCGLWVEIESAGSESSLAKEHPEWFITRYGKTVERILDLSKTDVKDYVESEIVRIIEFYKLDMFRLDYNLSAYEGGFNFKNGVNENTLWRHVEAIYDIFDRVGNMFPELQLENCASGGGRTDVGLVSRFTTTWVSDWFRMPRTVRILNGMSMALPPEYINRTFGVFEGPYRGNVESQMHVAIMAHPTILGITPSLNEANPALMECVKKYIKIYKEFIRPFHREAKVFHHTPVIPGADGSGWCALEYVSEDKKTAAAVVFRLVNATDEKYKMIFRGLNKSFNYMVRIEPEGSAFQASGRSLSQEGLGIWLDTALTSNLILLSAE